LVVCHPRAGKDQRISFSALETAEAAGRLARG
jgi:hypothetical protein